MVKTIVKQIGLIILLCAFTTAGTAADTEKFAVAAIHAHLYHESTGEINSTDLLDGKDHALWNTIIGEGEARKPSSTILVLVDLVGPSFLNAHGALLLKVSDGEKTLLEKTLSLCDWFNTGNKLVLPFLVYGTGCKKLEITATLQGLPNAQVKTPTLKKLVLFECGE
ncbi:MAG TPA: hypothetical protein VMS75_07785 [Terriglobales bacterium]|nr:hypothetical protein [Terriglobales bacterium]